MSNRKKQTVLVVDDMSENIDLLVETLQGEYAVKAALDGETALEIVRSSTPPDLVLMDVMMPGMDGYEACREIKGDIRSRDIPVIFVTAMGEERNETYGFDIGAVDYITKPINPAVVLSRVRTHIALHSQSMALEQKVAVRTSELYSTRLEIIRRLGVAAEYKDNETGNHILRMSKYCRILALAAGLDESHAELILNAAPMHDVGKIGIPDSILLKPGKLAPDEWEVMQSHASIGGEIIGEHDYDLMRMAGTIATTHHERWDGSGYPRGLAGEEIPIEGRIAAIADVFDALTSERPYKSAWSPAKACGHILESKGKHFDPNLVDLFIENIDAVLEVREMYV